MGGPARGVGACALLGFSVRRCWQLAQPRRHAKDEARGMALGRSMRTHAPKAPVASRLLPASYLFPKPEQVRIGGSSWGIFLSLVAQLQTPVGFTKPSVAGPV